jgi:hypothetical protein
MRKWVYEIGFIPSTAARAISTIWANVLFCRLFSLKEVSISNFALGGL